MAKRTRPGGGRSRHHVGRRNMPRFGRNVRSSGSTMRQNISQVPFSGPLVADRRKEVPTTRERELDMLKTSAAAIHGQLDAIHARITTLETNVGSVSFRAVVDARICVGCAACRQVCPATAIVVDTVARVDPLKCTGCGLCTTECPRGAITLQKV